MKCKNFDEKIKKMKVGIQQLQQEKEDTSNEIRQLRLENNNIKLKLKFSNYDKKTAT